MVVRRPGILISAFKFSFFSSAREDRFSKRRRIRPGVGESFSSSDSSGAFGLTSGLKGVEFFIFGLFLVDLGLLFMGRQHIFI